jgi:hypothetical protein
LPGMRLTRCLKEKNYVRLPIGSFDFYGLI